MMRRVAHPVRQCYRTLCTKKPRPRPTHQPPHLYNNMTVTEGRSWVTMVPRYVAGDPRARSKQLRLAGNARAAHQVLRKAGALHSRNEADLIEYLLVLLNTDEFKGPRERLQAMTQAMNNSNAAKPKAGYNILLTACAREASRVSDNSSVKRDVILETARNVWNEMSRAVKRADPKNIALMYRVCGDCKEMQLARDIREQTGNPGSAGSEEATAAYILCLGKCGRSAEAEQLYFGGSKEIRKSDKVLGALFRAYVAANRISKAEALIAMYGSTFLDLRSCNAFVKQCATLRLHESALEFVGRMSRGAGGFPKPTARTYNLLLRGLSAGTGSEDREVAAERGLVVVEQMRKEGIEPTTVTYNTMIRSLVFRGQMKEALRLYDAMDNPNRITFSHLMQGAANCRDIEMAEEVFNLLIDRGERPNYGFCKSYLEIVARVRGVNEAFEEAVRISQQFGEVLVFGDVGSHEAVRMALISACGKVGDLKKAFDALHLHLTRHGNQVGNLAPLYVATVLMQVCLECNAPGRALEVFHSLKLAGLEPNFEVYESLIYGLSSYVCAEMKNQPDIQEGEEGVDWDAELPDMESDSFIQEVASKGGSSDRNTEMSPWRLAHPSKVENDENVDDLSPQEALRTTVQLLKEMHEKRQGRAIPQAAYMYNTLIAGAAAIGDFELALQIFNKMSRRNNPGVVYFSKDESRLVSLNSHTSSSSSIGAQAGLAALVSTGMFESTFEFPAATVGTYNSMIDAAWRCGEPWFSFRVFEMMQMDRITEPNVATLSLLADIALSEIKSVTVEQQQRLLKEMDGVEILSEEVCKKRIRLRQKLVALKWS